MALTINGNGTLSGENVTSALQLNATGQLNATANLVVNGQGYSPTLTLTDGATISWDTDLGQVATVILGGNRTINYPSNLESGSFYALEIIQGTGGQTLSWNTAFKFTGAVAPTLSTAAGAKDYITFRSDGTNLYEQGRSIGVA